MLACPCWPTLIRRPEVPCASEKRAHTKFNRSLHARRNPAPNGGEFRAGAYRCRQLRPRPSGVSCSIKTGTPLKRLGPCRGRLYQYHRKALVSGAGSGGAAGCGSGSMLVFMRVSADSRRRAADSSRVDAAIESIERDVPHDVHTMGRRACARVAWVGSA